MTLSGAIKTQKKFLTVKTFEIQKTRLFVCPDCRDTASGFFLCVEAQKQIQTTRITFIYIVDPVELAHIGWTAAREIIDGFNWGTFLRSLIGDPPDGMIRAHAHHILFKEGLGEAQKALVQEGQKILYHYGIDPIKGVENLVWAPNIKGQHTTAALEHIVSELRNIFNLGGTKKQIVEKLKQLGEEAAGLIN